MGRFATLNIKENINYIDNWYLNKSKIKDYKKEIKKLKLKRSYTYDVTSKLKIEVHQIYYRQPLIQCWFPLFLSISFDIIILQAHRDVI